MNPALRTVLFSPARGPNLFTNGDNGTFATGIDGIALTYDAAVAWHEAVPSLKLTVTAGSPPSGVAMQEFAAVPGRYYEITATMMAPSTNTASNAATLSCNASGATASEGIQVTAEDTWQTKTFFHQATATTEVVYGWVLDRGIAWGSASDVAYFTNISVRLSRRAG